MKRYLLPLILLFALLLRLYGLNWDQNQHLHPDERFLTMVAVAQEFPQTLGEYFDSSVSKLNPTNIGFPFYVYGTFPVTFTHYVADYFHWGDYFNLTLVGRGISALFDVGIVLLVYLLAKNFEKKFGWNKNVKYFAAVLYSIMVLPIQQAHFFTVDSFVTFFMLASLACVIQPRGLDRALGGLFMGLAFASKINAIYILPLILFCLVYSRVERDKSRSWGQILSDFILFGFTTYITLRIADPYFFMSSNIFDIRPNPTLLSNIAQLQSFNNPTVWYPPGVQWISKTKILFPLQNIFFFGMGPVIFISAIVGVVQLFKKNRQKLLLAIYGWVLLFFLYQGIQFGMTMRYFYILYPLLAIPAGYFLTEILRFAQDDRKTQIQHLTIILLILIWPTMFMTIYSRPHSRITASKWIFENIPSGSVLAQEHWDDSLPLRINSTNKQYEIIQMPVFAPDDDAKWDEINSVLKKADYIIFTSNRGYGSIRTVPKRFPKMSKFYADLFEGKLPFKFLKEFTSYPVISDQWAEEAFTVYDHPKVTIFSKQK